MTDFEVKLKFRAKGNGCNSGVQFRSKMREDGLAIGYQADIYQSGGYLGGVCDELHNAHGPELLSANGSKTVIDKDGKRTRTPDRHDGDVQKWDAWNDYHIIAKGHQNGLADQWRDGVGADRQRGRGTTISKESSVCSCARANR